MNVTLIICNFNGFKYLKHTLPQWIEVLGKENIIVSDAKSTDDSIEFIESLNIKYIQGDFEGHKTNALNKTISVIDSEYTLLIDNDILPEPNIIEDVIELYESKPSTGIVYISLRNAEPSEPFKILDSGFNGRPLSNFLVYPPLNSNKNYASFHGTVISSVGGSFLIKTKELKETKFTEIVTFGIDDTEFSFYYRAKYCKNIILFSKYQLKHIGISNRASKEAAKNWKYFIFSNFWLAQRYLPHGFLFAIYGPILLYLVAIKQAFKYKQPGYIKSYFTGLIFTLKNLHKQR